MTEERRVLWINHEYRDNGHGQPEHAPWCKCEPSYASAEPDLDPRDAEILRLQQRLQFWWQQGDQQAMYGLERAAEIARLQAEVQRLVDLNTHQAAKIEDIKAERDAAVADVVQYLLAESDKYRDFAATPEYGDTAMAFRAIQFWSRFGYEVERLTAERNAARAELTTREKA